MSFNELLEFLFPVCVSIYFSLTKLSFLISETIFFAEKKCYVLYNYARNGRLSRKCIILSEG